MGRCGVAECLGVASLALNAQSGSLRCRGGGSMRAGGETEWAEWDRVTGVDRVGRAPPPLPKKKGARGPSWQSRME
jgi:hypothetical protein